MLLLTNLTGGLNPGDDNYLVTLANNIQSKYVNQNKALVLLPEWSRNGESTQQNSGFTEAAADAIFASIVQLDQALGGDVGEHDATRNLVRLYDNKGDLIRTQGALFDSPLHFIGFSRGAVVNSEIIQRLGTYFPYAGGKINADGTPVVDSNGKAVRDLQMTTIDPHDFYQESLKVDLVITGTIIKDFRDFHEPQVQVWDNVTFADNYYQTVADPNGSTWTPNGRFIDGADVNKLLNGKPGFTKDDLRGGPHGNVFSWYAGTADLAIDKVDNGYTQKPRLVYDQLGERGVEELFNPNDDVTLTPWYFSAGNEGSTEGIGTGWFYSVLGGGKEQRPTVDMSKRVPVRKDNTSLARMRGDYAVPTLFDGNFDAIAAKIDSQPVPGWSLNNGANYTSLQRSLVKWEEIGSLAQYRADIGYNPAQTNFALKLGDGLSEVTHNQFVVPDWGVLRLDIHVPQSSLNNGGRLKVYLEDTNSPDNIEIEEISLEEADPQTEAVTRTSVDGSTYNVKIPSNYEYDEYTIGYGSSGFESFYFNISPSLRGKVATLKLELH